MFIRKIEDLRGTKGEVTTDAWSSYRLLHAEDGMGVTLTDAVLEPGVHRPWWYKNHLEAVYCLEGEGIVEDLATGEMHPIRPGTLYALDKHDRHRLTVTSRMRVVCTFVPPLVGGELHDADGSYVAAGRARTRPDTRPLSLGRSRRARAHEVGLSPREHASIYRSERTCLRRPTG